MLSYGSFALAANVSPVASLSVTVLDATGEKLEHAVVSLHTNRLMAYNHLKHSIKKREAENGTIGVILIGVNRYKQIVETLAHSVGDQMVHALSTQLTDIQQEFDLLARVATDEFLLLLTDSDYEQCRTVAHEIIKKLALPITLHDAEFVPNLSAGLVMIPDHAASAEDAVRRASIALSDAIDTIESIATYQDGRDESHMRRLSIVADLRRAVEIDELTVYFQPKISMDSMQVFSVEALVRWIHPEHGFMAPDEFIGLAESSGNVGILTQWVLKAVIEQLSKWEREGIKLKAAVNLPALDLQDKSLFSRIKTLLESNNIPPNRLILEVTESAMMRDTESALAVLAQMREFGMAISIDDFGTGYSSLAKLKDMPIDELKIDRAFVTDIAPNSTKAMIIKAIIDLAHGMGLTVISEGVETQSEWDLLNELGNDVVQGFLIARPMPAADFTKWWHETYPKGKRSAA
jgi:diguanylate cyclase (GGDEF)-like protein